MRPSNTIYFAARPAPACLANFLAKCPAYLFCFYICEVRFAPKTIFCQKSQTDQNQSQNLSPTSKTWHQENPPQRDQRCNMQVLENNLVIPTPETKILENNLPNKSYLHYAVRIGSGTISRRFTPTRLEGGKGYPARGVQSTPREAPRGGRGDEAKVPLGGGW